jgi:hypothetical protein
MSKLPPWVIALLGMLFGAIVFGAGMWTAAHHF